MSKLNSEDFNAMKEAGFINEWKNPEVMKLDITSTLKR